MRISNSPLVAVAFLADRKLLVADDDGAVFLVFIDQYTPLSGRLQKIIHLSDGVACLRVSPFSDAHIFLIGSKKAKLRLWKLKQIKGHTTDDSTFVLYDGFEPLTDPHGTDPGENDPLSELYALGVSPSNP